MTALTPDPKRWRITKERVYLREERRLSLKAWSLYRGRKRIARYSNWQRCIDHIQNVYSKWPDFDKDASA